MAWLIFLSPATSVQADIAPESVGITTLDAPRPTWFFAKGIDGSANLFDAATGEMLGLLSLTPWTPAVLPNPRRGEIYAAETYYSRGVRGDRSDVLTVYAGDTLAPVHEIELPAKIAAVLPFRHYIALLDDDRHLAVFNMTPAQSVSIVDIETRRFVGEISTPGCALLLPSPDRAFLMLCGDGTLQLLRLDRSGQEAARLRSAPFFDVETDPVFDRPVAVPQGWLLASYEGNVFEVTVRGNDIVVGEPWSLLDDADREAGWRIGGAQLMAHHAGLDLMVVLAHVGEIDTHEEPGTEAWVIDRQAQRRIARITLPGPTMGVHITPTADPLLVAAERGGPLHVYDLRSTRLLRSIAEPGVDALTLQGF
ncbi:MAG: amine dehydrogenase large subunit [Pseudomonadales bacterium]